MKSSLPDLAELREKFVYNPATGDLYRRFKTSSIKLCSMKDNDGYLILRINGKSFRGHRIIWYMFTGMDPGESSIDHINRDRFDNRVKNLRTADVYLQSHNRSSAKNKTSDHEGVVLRGYAWDVDVTLHGIKRVYRCVDRKTACIIQEEIKKHLSNGNKQIDDINWDKHPLMYGPVPRKKLCIKRYPMISFEESVDRTPSFNTTKPTNKPKSKPTKPRRPKPSKLYNIIETKPPKCNKSKKHYNKPAVSDWGKSTTINIYETMNFKDYVY